MIFLKKIGTTRKLILTIRKRQLTFLIHVMRKVGHDNLTLIRQDK